MLFVVTLLMMMMMMMMMMIIIIIITNVLKYKDLAVQVQHMWNVTTKLIPVIIGATGTISKSLRQYLSNIPGKGEIKELQTTAILCTAHKLREVLMKKYKTYFTGEITLHVA